MEKCTLLTPEKFKFLKLPLFVEKVLPGSTYLVRVQLYIGLLFTFFCVALFVVNILF